MTTPRWPDTAARSAERGTDPIALITVRVAPVQARWRALSLLGGPPPALEVRRFSGEALQASMEKVLAGLPSDVKAADVEMGFDARGVQVVGAVKLSGGWSILSGVQYDYGGTWGGQVSVRKVWK